MPSSDTDRLFHRTGVRALVGAAIALALSLSGCSVGADDETVDHGAQTERQLLANGIDEDIVDCVTSVGRNDLERGPLTELALDELLVNCRAARLTIEQVEVDATPPPELLLVDLPWTFGDDPTLDRLWQGCEAGTGSACDDLFAQSPVGSEYEDFGLSCGRRGDVLDCVELDIVDEAAPAP